jgi:hypothetical protein
MNDSPKYERDHEYLLNILVISQSNTACAWQRVSFKVCMYSLLHSEIRCLFTSNRVGFVDGMTMLFVILFSIA